MSYLAVLNNKNNLYAGYELRIRIRWKMLKIPYFAISKKMEITIPDTDPD